MCLDNYIRLSAYNGITKMGKPKLHELHSLHASLCQAIADPVRIAILYELGGPARNVNDLVNALDLPQATVSRHLKILRQQTLVNTHRQGNFVFYMIADRSILDALDIIHAIKQNILSKQRRLLDDSSHQY